MCKNCHHSELEDFASQKKYRLADFFNSWWDDYCQHPTKPIAPWHYKAVNSIRVCRTAVLGIDYYACPTCGEVSEVRHNCKHRFCPTCSWLDTIKWSEKIKTQMLDIPHRHIVCTLPHQLNPLIEKNARAIYNILGRVSSDTFKDWIKTKYQLKTGVISVLHTFGERKNLHVHMHMIVAWGGVDFKTGELKTIKEEFVKYTFLQKKYRCKFEDELIALFDKGELKHNFANRIEFMQYIKKINDKNWQIHLEPPMQTPADVIRYIGRYSKRACLSEYKITNIEGEYISFQYKDYKDKEECRNPKSTIAERSRSKAKEKIETLHYRDFFPLLLQHVPLPNFRIVKYYGCYARFNDIPQEFKAKQNEPQLSEILVEEYQHNEKNPKYCKSCTCAKQYVYSLIDTRPKQQRGEIFDIKKHKHLIYIEIDKQTEQKTKHKAA